jgi:hypothetical protein
MFHLPLVDASWRQNTTTPGTNMFWQKHGNACMGDMLRPFIIAVMQQQRVDVYHEYNVHTLHRLVTLLRDQPANVTFTVESTLLKVHVSTFDESLDFLRMEHTHEQSNTTTSSFFACCARWLPKRLNTKTI